MANCKEPTSLPLFSKDVNPQTQSPLFGKLPPELRLEIFRLALTPYLDEERIYPFLSYYYRPTHIGGRRVALNLLSVCRRAWNEAIAVGYPSISIEDESFYWGWFERRPKAYRFKTVLDGEDGGWGSLNEEGDEDEYNDDYVSEEDEDEEDEEDEDEYDEHEIYYEENFHLSSQATGSQSSQNAEVSQADSNRQAENDAAGNEAGEPLIPVFHTSYPDSYHPDFPEEGETASEDGEEDDDEPVEEEEISLDERAAEVEDEDHTPWRASETDHPFQLSRHRRYKPYHWACVKSITIFPQLFSFSVQTFSQFFQRNPHLRPSTVRVVIRYTDWWSWEANERLNITIGMEPGLNHRVIFPDSVSTFILELETREGKKPELDEVVRDMRKKKKDWKWARSDGAWLEMEPTITREWEWMGPTMFLDNGVTDEDNYYGAYRFPHHPKGERMNYVGQALTFKFRGNYAANVAPGGTARFEMPLRGTRRREVLTSDSDKGREKSGSPLKRSFDESDGSQSSSDRNVRVREAV